MHMLKGLHRVSGKNRTENQHIRRKKKNHSQASPIKEKITKYHLKWYRHVYLRPGTTL